MADIQSRKQCGGCAKWNGTIGSLKALCDETGELTWSRKTGCEFWTSRKFPNLSAHEIAKCNGYQPQRAT